eukprot:6194669-Pleurochrysis_carterae.AAC.1
MDHAVFQGNRNLVVEKTFSSGDLVNRQVQMLHQIQSGQVKIAIEKVIQRSATHSTVYRRAAVLQALHASEACPVPIAVALYPVRPWSLSCIGNPLPRTASLQSSVRLLISIAFVVLMALAKAPKDDFGGTPSAKTQGKVLGVPAWSSLENLAACKASIEALELHQAQMNGTAKSKATEAMLESSATASFPSWLETVADEHPGVWRDLPTKAGNMWTIETSKAMRTSKGGIYHRWKSVLQPYMLGVINPAYASCLNEDGSAPAGMTREHIIAKIKHAIWIYKVTEKPKRRKNKGAKAANKGDGDDDDDDDDDKEAAGGEAGSPALLDERAVLLLSPFGRLGVLILPCLYWLPLTSPISYAGLL